MRFAGRGERAGGGGVAIYTASIGTAAVADESGGVGGGGRHAGNRLATGIGGSDKHQKQGRVVLPCCRGERWNADVAVLLGVDFRGGFLGGDAPGKHGAGNFEYGG